MSTVRFAIKPGVFAVLCCTGLIALGNDGSKEPSSRIVPLTPPAKSVQESGFDFGSLKTDTEADQWLRDHSSTYARVAAEIKGRKDLHGYRFASKEDVRRGMVLWSEGYIEIQLNPALAGADRVTTIIFEMCNGSRHRDHQEIDRAADEGVVGTADEFGLAHEMIEYEALRIHGQILRELDARAGPLPREFFCFVTPRPRSARENQLPDLSRYLKAQKESGHTEHYYQLFQQRKAGQTTPKDGKKHHEGLTKP